MSVDTILLLLAFVCFVLATANFSPFGLNLVGLGLALWVLSLILGVFVGLPQALVVVLVIVLLLLLVVLVATRIPRKA